MSDVDVTVSDNIAGSIETKLTAIAKAARSAHTSVNTLQKALNNLNTPSQAFAKATQNANALGRAVNQVNSAVGGLRGNVTQLNTGLGRTAAQATAVTRGFRQMTTGAQTTGRAFSGLSSQTRQLAGFLAAGFGVAAFLDVANAADNLNNKLLNLATSQQNFYVLQNAMFRSANETRQSVDAFTDAFVRYSKVLVPLGSSQKEILQITETLSKAFVVAGKTSAEASSGVIQLGQALQSGRLSGDEFRSVMENMPIEVIQALADELGVPITQLKKLSTEGKITANVIRNAILGITKDIDTKFNRTIVTVDQAINILRNNFIKFFSENQGPARILASTILLLAQHLDIVIPLVVAFAAAWATVALANIIRDLWLLAGAILAVSSPAILATAAIVALVGIMAVLGEVVAFLIGGVDGVRAYFNALEEGAGRVGDSIGDFLVKVRDSAGVTQLQTAVAGLGTSMDNTATDADQLKDAIANIQMIGPGFSGLNGQIQTTSQALDSTATSADKAGSSIKLAAGELATLSGRNSGVYDVAKALEATGNSALKAYSNTKVVVQELATLSGRSSGVYKVTAAVDDLNASVKKTSNSLQTLAANMKKAFQNGGGAPLRSPVNSPSFQNIGSTGNTGDSPSIQRFAKGGEFMVGGKSGVDRNLVRFRASRGEKVKIETRSQARRSEDMARHVGPGMVTVYMTVNTPDADSFGRSRRQVAADLQAIVG